MQTSTYVAIVARRANAPLALISAGGTAAPLDWSAAEHLGGSGYCSVTLVEPPVILGTERLEPVWVWPQLSLATERAP